MLQSCLATSGLTMGQRLSTGVRPGRRTNVWVLDAYDKETETCGYCQAQLKQPTSSYTKVFKTHLLHCERFLRSNAAAAINDDKEMANAVSRVARECVFGSTCE